MAPGVAGQVPVVVAPGGERQEDLRGQRLWPIGGGPTAFLKIRNDPLRTAFPRISGEKKKGALGTCKWDLTGTVAYVAAPASHLLAHLAGSICLAILPAPDI